MSNQYLNALVADKSEELVKLIEELISQDAEGHGTESESIKELLGQLKSLKKSAKKRLAKLLAEKGLDPEEYPF